MLPEVISHMQRQVKENIALVRSPREGLLSGQLAGSSLIKTFLSVYSSRQGLTEGPLLSEKSCVSEGSISSYALDLSFQRPNVRGAYSKSPLNIYLDVEPCLSTSSGKIPTRLVSQRRSSMSVFLQLIGLRLFPRKNT